MRMWGKRGLVGSAIAAAALCSLLPIGPSAAAQAPDQQAANVPPTPAPQPSSVQEIVITGSRIPRPNLTASSPITVVNSQEVKLQGAVLTETLINSLPQAQPDQGAFLSNGATGTSTVNLRGFGPQRTLVLVNLCKLAIRYTGAESESVGTWDYLSREKNYVEERNRLLRQLAPRGGLAFA